MGRLSVATRRTPTVVSTRGVLEYIQRNIVTDNLVLELLPADIQPATWKDLSGNGYDVTPESSSIPWGGLKNGLAVPTFSSGAGFRYFKNSTANWRSGDSQGAIGIFARGQTTNGATRALLSSADEGSSTRYLTFEKLVTSGKLAVFQRNNDTLDTVTGSSNFSDGKPHSAFLTSDGSAWAIIFDGVAEDLAVTSGSNTGDWFADTSNRDNFVVGAQIHASVTLPWLWSIGMVLVYSVAPSVAQIKAMHDSLIKVFP